MKKNRKELADALGNITQLGLSVAISFLLWILIASWLRDRFSLGNGIMIAGVISGAGSAVLSFVKFCKKAVSKERKHEK